MRDQNETECVDQYGERNHHGAACEGAGHVCASFVDACRRQCSKVNASLFVLTSGIPFINLSLSEHANGTNFSVS